MAGALNKVGTPSFCSPNPPMSAFPPFTAGEAIAFGDVISLHSDGKAYRATPGTTRIGVAGIAADLGDSVTPTQGLRFNWGSGMTPGAPFYLDAAVPGGINTTAVSGDCSLGYVLDDGMRVQFNVDLNP